MNSNQRLSMNGINQARGQARGYEFSNYEVYDYVTDDDIDHSHSHRDMSMSNIDMTHNRMNMNGINPCNANIDTNYKSSSSKKRKLTDDEKLNRCRERNR